MKETCHATKNTLRARLSCATLAFILLAALLAFPCRAAGAEQTRTVYSGVSEAEQARYTALYNAISTRADQLDVRSWNCSYTTVYNALKAVLDTYPELVYCVYEQCQCYSINNKAVRIELAYDSSYDQIQAKVNAVTEELMASMDLGSMAPWEIALTLHEYLTTHVRYDYVRFSNGTIKSDHPEAYTVAGALVDGEAVCSGYAKAYQLLMTRFGIDCVVVSSAQASHAWNMVRFSSGGPWYHVDVTWDDPYWDTLGRSCHDYFLLSDAELFALDPDRVDYFQRGFALDGPPSAPVSFEGNCKFWEGTNSQCCYSQGIWYYINQVNKRLMSYDPYKKELRTLLRLPNNTWKEWGRRGWEWPDSYSYLFLSCGSLYFNTCSDIRRYDPKTGGTEIVAEVDTANGFIYGFGAYDGGVGYVIRQKPKADGPEVITPLTGYLWDVEYGSWYASAVNWSVQRGVFSLSGTGSFYPYENCTRGQMVIWLWRLAGSPAPTTQHGPFRDVSPDSEYADAVLWAWEQGYVSGTSKDTFSPNSNCTRAQAVTILNRVYSCHFPGYSNLPYVVFKDVDYNAWYAPSTIWAIQAGIVTGMGDSTFGTNLTCTRAQMITMLCRADTSLSNRGGG